MVCCLDGLLSGWFVVWIMVCCLDGLLFGWFVVWTSNRLLPPLLVGQRDQAGSWGTRFLSLLLVSDLCENDSI